MSLEVSVEQMTPEQVAELRKQQTRKIQMNKVECIGYYGTRGNIPSHQFWTPEEPKLGRVYMCHKCNGLVEEDKKPAAVEIKYKRA